MTNLKQEITENVFDSILKDGDSFKNFLQEMSISGQLDMKSIIQIVVILCNRLSKIEDALYKDKTK